MVGGGENQNGCIVSSASSEAKATYFNYDIHGRY